MGTILATILAVLVAQIALGSALIAVFRHNRQKEAKPTPKRHEPEFVTREQLKAAIEEATKHLEWEWTEMYEKFDKLHLRLAKREARQRGAQQPEPAAGTPSDQPVLDIRQFRRPGSL